MNKTLLYYPTIDIPKDEWLRHAIVYWDEVSSIVPASSDKQFAIILSDTIKYLEDEGQFRAIAPDDLIKKSQNHIFFNEFQNEFQNVIASEEFINFNKVYYHPLTHITLDFPGIKFSRIHQNKVSDQLLHFLTEKGLARRIENDYEWFEFEQNTALIYMSILAKYLALVDSENTAIGTDIKVYENFNFKKGNAENGFAVLNLDIKNLLPTPSPDASFKKIVEFKRKREDHLKRFQKFYSDIQTKLSGATSQEELKEIVWSFENSLKAGVKDLNAVMKDSGINTFFKTMKSIISLKAPAFFLAGATTAEYLHLFSIPVKLEVAGMALSAAVEITGNYIELNNLKKAQIRSSPFAFLAMAEKEGIIQK